MTKMQISELTESKIEEMSLGDLKEFLFPGDLKAIARSTDYDCSYIWYVIKGHRKSAKIDAAIRERVRQNLSLRQFRKGVHNA
jgi:hypothetical protein